MELTFTHYVSLIVVLALSFVPGWYLGRKVKSADDYSLGGRAAGIPLVTGAILGTIIGGAATLGTAQLAFSFGLCAWWFTLGSGIALLIMALFYARKLRSSSVTTISEYLVTAFGPAAGPVTSIAATLGIFFSIVASGLTAVHLFSAIFHLPNYLTCVLILAIVLAYVLVGGIGGSGGAGIFKTVLLFVTLFAGGFAALSMSSGVTQLFASFPSSYGDIFGQGVSNGLYSLGAMIVGVISTQSYVQALLSAKSEKVAAQACGLAALICIPVGLPSIAIGMFMKLHHPEIAPIQALPLFLINYLPAWLGGAALTGLILSAMGSIGGLALGCGTMIARDIFGNVLHIQDSKKLLWINRMSVVAITVLSLLFVLANLNSYVLNWNYMSMALRGAGVFIPLTCAIALPGRVHPSWGRASIMAGVLVAIGWTVFYHEAANSLLLGLMASCCFILPGFWFGRSERLSSEE